MLRIQLAFGVVIGVETNGPRIVFRIVPFRCACGQEHVRHFLGIHVPVNSGIGRCAQCAQGQQDFILLYQTANHLHRFGRAVAIVQGDEVDLAAVNATCLVQLLEVSRLNLADDAVSRGWAAVWHGLANFDFSVAGTGIVFFLRGSR